VPYLILDTTKLVLRANAITASWTSNRATTAGYAARNCAVNLLFGSWARLMAPVGRKILSLYTEYLHEHAELEERGRGGGVATNLTPVPTARETASIFEDNCRRTAITWSGDGTKPG